MLGFLGPALSGLFGLMGSTSASRAQSQAASDQLGIARENMDFQKGLYADAAPFRQGGMDALGGLLFELGIGPRPSGYQGYEKTPGYDFRMQQGTNALESSAAARGGLYSGATGTALNQFGQGIAQQDYGNYLSQLGGMVGLGQTGVGQAAAGVANASGAIGDAFGAAGNAKSAGYIGAANALNTGIGNYYGMQQYNNALAAQPPQQPGYGGIY